MCVCGLFRRIHALEMADREREREREMEGERERAGKSGGEMIDRISQVTFP